ncbi:hypothetical protein [Latilactobacillus fuchuensis]|uniref:hypothetical protein n=1 Tax=Latilactobacillus fuchuensis TaxID=164393 RepID=UPI0020C75D4F|nr:hypothetical protein [Latilactobacillus fuchuensis]MCP8857493.1 hypothetical protein [Latilactobacillus fuchuensis]
MDDEKIGFIERFGYGLGDFACNLVWASMGSFIMFYYTDVVGIGAAVIGGGSFVRWCLGYFSGTLSGSYS